MDNSCFDNTVLDSSLNVNYECVNPNEACGILEEPLPDLGAYNLQLHNMESSAKLTLSKFSGYPTEDAERFLSNFSAYCTFHRITLLDPRKVAAFQLHLQGPALSWYTCLADEDKSDWDTLQHAFKTKYLSEGNKPVLLVETEQFMNLRLLPHQQLEDYFSKIVDKGRKIQKSQQEVLLKFIEGLPSQLAFFVRAGNPDDVHAALTSAKLGEAYGYRALPTVDTLVGCAASPTTPNVGNVAAAQSGQSTRLDRLEQKVDKLCSRLENMSSLTPIPGQPRKKLTCHACKGAGHIKRVCNWARGQCDPQTQCQLCEQFGHTSKNCATHSGNVRNPRDTGRDPLGGQQ